MTDHTAWQHRFMQQHNLTVPKGPTALHQIKPPPNAIPNGMLGQKLTKPSPSLMSRGGAFLSKLPGPLKIAGVAVAGFLTLKGVKSIFGGR